MWKFRTLDFRDQNSISAKIKLQILQVFPRQHLIHPQSSKVNRPRQFSQNVLYHCVLQSLDACLIPGIKRRTQPLIRNPSPYRNHQSALEESVLGTVSEARSTGMKEDTICQFSRKQYSIKLGHRGSSSPISLISIDLHSLFRELILPIHLSNSSGSARPSIHHINLIPKSN